MATPGAECVRRLSKDYLMVRKNPPPYVTAHPDPSNLLLWHYTVEGPPGSPYEGGLYHGKLVFPADFPFNPPSVFMFTPNGRFKTGQRLCFSMSDFHPKEWNPMWSVSSILTGFLSFMLEEHETYGSMKSTLEEKRAFAAASHAFNMRDPTWPELFPEHADREIVPLTAPTHTHPVPASREGHSSLHSGGGLSQVVLVAVFCVFIAYAMLRL